jgi:mono/diheme cytochrome c family protein
MRSRKPLPAITAAWITVAWVAMTGCRERPAASAFARPLRDTRFERTPARIERGRYLAEGVLQCFNCHSDRDPNRPGAPPLDGKKGAGHVWYDEPDRRLVSPNLTPDPETGAGKWTDDMLARAIREGVGHDGRPLHPQMWYDAFRYISDEDVASVVVYLRTLPPVKNALPPTRLAKGRRERIEKGLHPLTAPVPEPDRSTPEKRGRYLVTIADCQGCHTAWEAPKNPGRFGGGNHVELTIGGKNFDDFSHNLTPDPTGIPYYDDALFIEALRTGKVRTRDLGPIMPWTVFRNMTDADLVAIRAYLKTLLPVAHLVDNAEPAALCPVCGQVHGGGALNRAKDSRAIPIDPRSVEGCEGTYRFPDFTLTLTRANGKVFWDDGSGKSELKTDDNRFFYAVSSVDVIEFERDASGRIRGAIDRAFDDERGSRQP